MRWMLAPLRLIVVCHFEGQNLEINLGVKSVPSGDLRTARQLVSGVHWGGLVEAVVMRIRASNCETICLYWKIINLPLGTMLMYL